MAVPEWSKIIELGIDGETDANIAAILKTLTVGPIKPLDAGTWLRVQNLWKNTDHGMVGTFAEKKPTLPQLLKDLLDELWASIWGGQAELLRTDDPVYAAMFAQGVAGLKAAGAMTQEQIDAFYLLDGGLAYPDATEAEVAAARTAYTTGQAKEANRGSLDQLKADADTRWNEYIAGDDSALTKIQSAAAEVA